MRIGMHQAAAGQQPAGGFDRRNYHLVRIARLAVWPVYRAAGKKRHARQINPIGRNCVRHRQAVCLPELEIVGAVSGGDMYEAGSLIGLDKAGREQRHVEIVALSPQRMRSDSPVESLAWEPVED